jgi:hypothetical protein
VRDQKALIDWEVWSGGVETSLGEDEEAVGICLQGVVQRHTLWRGRLRLEDLSPDGPC